MRRRKRIGKARARHLGARPRFAEHPGIADWRFRTSSGPVSVQARAMFGVNNGDMMRDAATAGLGFAMLPAFIAGPAVKAGELVAVPPDVAPDEEFLYMAHAQGRNPSAKLRALREHLVGCFGNPPYWDAIFAAAVGDKLTLADVRFRD